MIELRLRYFNNNKKKATCVGCEHTRGERYMHFRDYENFDLPDSYFYSRDSN